MDARAKGDVWRGRGEVGQMGEGEREREWGNRRVTYNALGVLLGFSLLDGHVHVGVEDLPQGLDRLHPQLCQRLCSPVPKPLRLDLRFRLHGFLA